MWPDPGAAELAAARRTWTARERMRLAAELRDRAFDLAWAALREREEAVGRLDELARARFVLQRLYPEMAGPRLDEVVAQLEIHASRGDWPGFDPPAWFQEARDRP